MCLRRRLPGGSLVALVLVLIMSLGMPGESRAMPALQSLESNWPMLMHDASHSGYTATTLDIRSGLHLQWKFSLGERVEVEVQPVVADGRVYVGVMNGKMYCLDAATGEQEWVYQAGGPIPHTAAVAGGRVFFGALDGRVYALNAVSGTEEWVYSTEGPVYSAPAVVDGTVFIGSLDRYLYALDANSGTLRWRFQTGGRVATSPAVGDERVYFGSEDMYAYCVRASDGQLIWKTLLHGYGMSNTYPVLSNETGVVIFVTTKPGASAYVHVEDYPDVPENSDIRATWRQYYTTYPGRRHLYYLDAATGADKWDGGDRYQPLPLPYWGLIVPILDGEGHAWFPAPSGEIGHESILDHDNRLCRIDLHTGETVQVADNEEFQMRDDETGRHTLVGGRYFYTISEDLGVYDLTTGIKRALFGNGPPYNFGTHMDPLDPLPTKHLWRYGGVIAMGGVPNASPFIVAGGRGYYISYSWLYCLGPVETTPPPATPRSDLASPYWPVAPTITDIQIELASRITQIIATGHLDPTARFIHPEEKVSHGYASTSPTFWFEGELVRTIAEALPFLPSGLQNSVKDYLRSEVENYLLNPAEYAYRRDNLAYDAGLKTYWFADNENLVAERLYAIWAYAYYTADWMLIEDNWDFIKGLFDQKLSAKYNESLGFCQFQDWHVGYLLDLNQQIGGALGVSRMAAHVGAVEVQARAEHMLEGMYAARIDLGHYVQRLYDSGDLQRLGIRLEPDGRLNNEDIMHNYNNPNETIPFREYRDRDSDIRQIVWWDGADSIHYYSGLGHPGGYAVMWGYMPMYPEVAELLRTYLLPETQEYVNTYVMNDPWWWLNDLSHSKVGGGEHLYEGPALSSSIFQTKAYVLQESADDLRRQLPLPYASAGYRDLYRLQNLIAILQAPPQVSKSVNCAAADYGEALAYTISLVGTGATATVTDTVPAGTTYVPDSAHIEPQIGTLTANSDLIHWTGVLTEYASLELSFAVSVTVMEPLAIVNTAIADDGEESRELTATTIANGLKSYLPIVMKGW